MGCVGVWVYVGRSGRDSWTLTTQLGLKPRGCTHTGLSHSYIPQGGVGNLASAFMELADIPLKLNPKVGILFPICPSKLYFQPCQSL